MIIDYNLAYARKIMIREPTTSFVGDVVVTLPVSDTHGWAAIGISGRKLHHDANLSLHRIGETICGRESRSLQASRLSQPRDLSSRSCY
ncbi:hypothetical protein VTK73DRAFT_7771 [Phialemonium thermophilum]|uniref:Transcriptional regulator n=1 Tax=Phialemonium thermophilum TaxID=223376 RepID=A0ABR3XSL8_9PEZI